MASEAGEVTCETLSRQVETVAARLTQAGLGAGDVIVFQAGQRLEALVLFWAAMAVGAVFAPLDPGWPDYMVERALKPVRPRLAVATAERCALYQNLFPEALVVALAPDVADDAEVATGGKPWADWISGETGPAVSDDIPHTAPAAYLFTSGTTGAPKAVMLSRGALAAGARLTLKTFEWRPGERLINLPEPHTMSGLRNGLVAAPLGGLHWIPFGAAQRPRIIGPHFTHRASQSHFSAAMATARCRITSNRVAARAGKNGALPVIVRLMFEPTTRATTMSKGVACEKVRRPVIRMQATPNRNSSTARKQS